MFEWLQYNKGPADKLNDYWNKTHKTRRSLLLVDQLSVTEYLETFLCLRLQEGIQLVCTF